ncbi:metabotropic glutamate receptor 2-like isoform X2 [Liolophura sinensis]|uniref:metabotropic glutamate receptor 2-like isoform X2 n=1 Tax=Liolophura sinensis TaxID=3198878 RepID=UPI003158DABC
MGHRAKLCLLLSLACNLAWAREECGPASACLTTADAAILPVDDPQVNNHIYVGGMFGVREMGPSIYNKGAVRESGILHLEMFLYTLKNVRPLDSYKVKVGGIAFDSGSLAQQTVENVLGFETCKVPYGIQNGTNPSRIEPRYVLAYVGPETSDEAVQTGIVLRDLNKTQITNADSPLLANKNMFSYLLRTTPSASLATDAMVAEMKLNNWEHVIAVYSDTAQGRGLLHSFKTATAKNSICIVETLMIPTDYSAEDMAQLADELLRLKSAYWVAVLAENMYAKPLLTEMGKRPDVRGSLGFMGAGDWAKDNQDVIANANGAADGAIIFAPKLTRKVGRLTDFETYFRNLKPDQNMQNPWFADYWMEKLNCRLPGDTTHTGLSACTGSETLMNVNIEFNKDLASTFLAVEAILEGTKKAIENAKCNNSVCSHLLNTDNSGTQIYEAIRKVTLLQEAVFSDTTNGPPNDELKYYIYNLKVDSIETTRRFESIGQYDASTDTITNQRAVVQYTASGEEMTNLVTKCPREICCDQVPVTTPRPTSSSSSPSTTTDPTHGGRLALLYVDADVEITGAYPSFQNRTQKDLGTRFEYGSVWIIALGVLAGLGILSVIIFEIYIMTLILPNRSTRQLRSMWLGQLLLFGIFISYLTLFAFIFTPTKATCGITRFGVGVSYAVCFAVLLVKLMVIMTSKNTEGYIPGDAESPNYLKGAYQLLLFLFTVGVQIVIDIQWLIQVPPEAVRVMSNAGDQVWICNHYTWRASIVDGMTTMSTFLRNEFENHLLSLVYVMLLILITTLMALKAHGITTNHRESIFIGIAAGFSIPIWLAWTLVGGLNRNNTHAHEYGDACLAFGLFITATLILFSMFLPKVRQLVNMGVEGIYLEDDRETIYGSVYNGLPPPSYKSTKGPGSVIYVNNSSDSLHRVHPKSHSVYSAPVTYARRPESMPGTGSRVLTVTGDLTGKTPVPNGRQLHSEIAYPTARSVRSDRSDKGTMQRSRSQQNLGSL